MDIDKALINEFSYAFIPKNIIGAFTYEYNNLNVKYEGSIQILEEGNMARTLCLVPYKTSGFAEIPYRNISFWDPFMDNWS